jgi:hypothetical protein
MPTRADETPEDEAPPRVVFKRAVTIEDLKADTEYDPAGADEFVAFVRALRKEGSK